MATITATPFIDHALNESRSDAIRWIRVRGDLTSADAVVEAAGRLRAACDGIRRLVVDTCGVEDLDTKFIAALIELQRCARSAHIALEIIPSSAVARWLDICRLSLR